MNATTDPGLYRHLDQMAPWNDRHHVLEVISVSDEAPDVKTFHLPVRQPDMVPLQAGPVRDAGTATARRAADAHLHAVVLAFTAVLDRGDGESAGGHYRDALDVRQTWSPAHTSKPTWPTSFLFAAQPSGGEISVHLGRLRGDAMMSMLRWLNDCGAMYRCRLRQLRARAEEIIFRKELELLAAACPACRSAS